MQIEIYGIDEPNYRCPGCEYVKKMFDECKLTYTFKRIVKMQNGFPTVDKILKDELRDRIAVGQLRLPYIFIDNQNITPRNLPGFLERAGYDI